MSSVVCSKCGRKIEGSCGYDPATQKPICYDCCAREMYNALIHAKPGDKFTMYIRNSKLIPSLYEVTDWTRKFKHLAVGRKGKHNWGIDRVDCWFNMASPEGGRVYFWGVHYGSMNTVTHVRCVKGDHKK